MKTKQDKPRLKWSAVCQHWYILIITGGFIDFKKCRDVAPLVQDFNILNGKKP